MYTKWKLAVLTIFALFYGVAAIPAQSTGPFDHLSVSVTPGSSARALARAQSGAPALYDNAVGEGKWRQEASPQQTIIPPDITALGLPNAEVRGYAAGLQGVEEFRVTRTADPWIRALIDERPSRGKPCAVRSARDTSVFAPAHDLGLLALRAQEPGGWLRLTAVESWFAKLDIAAVSCVVANVDQLAIVATTRTGSVHLAILDEQGGVLTAAQLAGEVDTASSGHATVTATAGSRVDVFGVNTQGSLLHWQTENPLSPQASLEPAIVPGNSSRLYSYPTAAWHNGGLYVAARTFDQNIAIFAKSPESGSWTVQTLSATGQPVLSGPFLTSQPDELSVLTLAGTGSVIIWRYADGTWVPGSLADANTQPAKAFSAFAKATATQTLQQYIQSIPLNPVLPPTPPTVTATTIKPRTDGGVRYQDTTRTIQRSANLSEAVAYNPNSDVAFACNLIQGKSVKNGLLAAIGATRAPCTITLLDVGGTGPLSLTISSPSLSTVTQGVRDLIRGVSPVNATAYVDYDSQSGRTLEDALLKLGVSVDFLGQSVKASVQSTSSRKASTVVVKLLQRYYTIAVDSPLSASSMFAPGVTVDDVKATINSGNPPTYISSMSFGRMLFYTFESTEDVSKLEAAVDAVFDVAKVKGTVSLSVEQQQVFKNTKIRLFALGGSAADAINLVTAADFASGLRDYLQNGKNFSVESPGAPLAYTIKYLKDGTVFQSNLSTTWYTTETYALPEKATFKIGLGPKLPGIAQGTLQTGFYVRPGDRYSIQASGSVWSGVFLTGSNPPNGWYTWKTPTKGIGFLNETVSPFSLLFRIGDMAPPPYAGYGFPSRDYSSTTGELGLLINSNNFASGAGYFNVTVSVERRQN